MKQHVTVAVLIAAALLGCGANDPAPARPDPAPPAGPVGTLKELQNGDRACYVIVESAQGEQSIEGSFELCAGGTQDASALIGKPITYTTERAKVHAASCQGDPECADSDEVDLVSSISAAP